MFSCASVDFAMSHWLYVSNVHIFQMTSLLTQLIRIGFFQKKILQAGKKLIKLSTGLYFIKGKKNNNNRISMLKKALNLLF